jgi:hypothetical protein
MTSASTDGAKTAKSFFQKLNDKVSDMIGEFLVARDEAAAKKAQAKAAKTEAAQAETSGRPVFEDVTQSRKAKKTMSTLPVFEDATRAKKEATPQTVGGKAGRTIDRNGDVIVNGVKKKSVKIISKENAPAPMGEEPKYTLVQGPTPREVLVQCFADDKNNLLGVNIDLLGPKVSLESPAQIQALLIAADILRAKIATPVTEEKLTEAKENMTPQKSNVVSLNNNRDQQLNYTA